MDVQKLYIIDTYCSCNFCQGRINPLGNGLIYDYKHVYTFTRSNASGLMATICEKCAKELIQKIKELKKTVTTNP